MRSFLVHFFLFFFSCDFFVVQALAFTCSPSRLPPAKAPCCKAAKSRVSRNLQKSSEKNGTWMSNDPMSQSGNKNPNSHEFTWIHLFVFFKAIEKLRKLKLIPNMPWGGFKLDFTGVKKQWIFSGLVALLFLLSHRELAVQTGWTGNRATQGEELYPLYHFVSVSVTIAHTHTHTCIHLQSCDTDVAMERGRTRFRPHCMTGHDRA